MSKELHQPSAAGRHTPGTSRTPHAQPRGTPRFSSLQATTPEHRSSRIQQTTTGEYIDMSVPKFRLYAGDIRNCDTPPNTVVNVSSPMRACTISTETSSHLRLLLQASNDALNGLLKVRAPDRLLGVSCGNQSCLVAHIRNVRAYSERWRVRRMTV